jgi:hypothetical protein
VEPVRDALLASFSPWERAGVRGLNRSIMPCSLSWTLFDKMEER